MNLITLSFEVAEAEQKQFISDINTVTSFWKDQGFIVTLYRDIGNRKRFLQMFQTDKTVDQMVELLQNEASAKKAFDRIKNLGSRVIVTAMEQVSE